MTEYSIRRCLVWAIVAAFAWHFVIQVGMKIAGALG